MTAAHPHVGTFSTMGMFDFVHTGQRCGQTKAFSSVLDDLTPGSAVPSRYPGLTSYGVAMREGGWLVIRHGYLQDWVEQAPTGVPLLDNEGYLLTRRLPADYLYTHTTAQTAPEPETTSASGTNSELFAELQAVLNAAANREHDTQAGRPIGCDQCARLQIDSTLAPPSGH